MKSSRWQMGVAVLAAFANWMPSTAMAQKLKTLFLDKRSATIQSDSTHDQRTSAFDVESFPRLLTNDGGMSVFDNYYVDNLRRLADSAGSRGRPEDIDYEQAEDVARRAMTVKITDTVNRTVNQSELKNEYRALMRGIAHVRKYFNYSLQEGPQGYSVAKKGKGKKLIELSVDPSPRTLLTPQLKIGDNGRLRYDTDNHGVVFELRGHW